MIAPPIRAAFAGRSCLVTGGTGLIGRQVVRQLLELGAQVRIVSLDRLKVDDRAEHVFGDLSRFDVCCEITRDTDFVFHIAGVKGSIEVTRSQPASFFVPLLMMNTNLLEACRVQGVEKVVYTSSIGAYASAEVFREAATEEEGPPMDEFPGWAKRMAEMQIQAYRRQYGLENFAIVRPCNVYGPGDNFDPANAMVIPSLLARIRANPERVVVWGDGTAVRDFAYSRDVAEGILLALHHGTGGRYMNLGSGVGYSVRELIDTLHSFIDFQHEFDRSKPAGYPKRVMDISLARRALGYAPMTTLSDGLRETWEWYLDHVDEHKSKNNYFTTHATRG
jgi:GDP-L-fucose synthase